MDNAALLHQKYNPRFDQIPPVCIKSFDRVKLARLLAELGYKRGVEVGVADGRNSLTLCQNIPGLELYGIDPWLVYSENPRAHDNQDECYRLATERLAPYNVLLIRAMSMDAVRDFAPGSIDFVYIDGHHGFDWVMQDLIEWGKRVRPGGIISGHDYYRFRWAGVVDAVDAYTKAHQVKEWFIDDMRETSFFWVKQ
jgi:predicted O-methyltransferase YrrM